MMTLGHDEIRMFLVRHGETDWNAQRRYIGDTDIPLNDNGRRRALALAEQLADAPISAVYSGDLSRARETADRIALPHDLSVHADPRLREMSFGPFEGMTYDEMVAKAKAEVAAWTVDPFSASLPGAEPFSQLVERARLFFSERICAHRGESVLVVTHGGPFRVLLTLSQGISHKEARLLHVPPGAMLEIRFCL